MLNPGWRFAIVLHASRSSRRDGRTAGSGSSGRRVLPRRPLARAVIWRQKFLPYLEAVGDRAELQDVRRFSPDLFRVGDGAAAVIALRDSDVKQGVVNAVVHVLGAALVVRRGAGRLRRGEGIVDGGAAGREDERLAGISEASLARCGVVLCHCVAWPEGGRRARRIAGSGSSGRRVLPRRPLARAVIWRQKFCRTSRPSEIERNCRTSAVSRLMYSVWATAQPPSLH